MKVFRTTEEIRGAPKLIPELERRLSWLIDQVQQADSRELGELVCIIVVEPGDRIHDINEFLQFDVLEEGPETIESYPGWYELILIVNDGGFGYWIFVPRVAGVDGMLLEHCASKLPSAGANPC